MAFFFLTYYLYKYFDALTHTTLYDFCCSRTTNKSIVEIVKGKHMLGVRFCFTTFYRIQVSDMFLLLFICLFFVSNPLSLSLPCLCTYPHVLLITRLCFMILTISPICSSCVFSTITFSYAVRFRHAWPSPSISSGSR